MLTFSKVSHISFSVRDAEASARWYRDVLGFQPLDQVKGDSWLGILQIHLATRTIVEFQQHDANAGEEFDPRRTGLDHLAFQVDSRADLETWQAHLERLGIRYTPISDNDYGSVLTFKDPDAIQLELFHRPNHP